MISTQSKEYARGMRAFQKGDYSTAYHILKVLADGGHTEAQVAVGNIFHLGLGGLAIDEDEAMRWYTLACAKGDGLASNNLGTIALSRGDRKAATEWYSKARQQGFPHSPRVETE